MRRMHAVPKRGFTVNWIDRLSRPKHGQIRYLHRLTTGLSLCLVVSSSCMTWAAITYVGGKPQSKKLGRWPQMHPKDAKKAAEEFFAHPAKALAVRDAPTLGELFTRYLSQYVEPRQYRTQYEVIRVFAKYIAPRLGSTPVSQIDRADIVNLVDSVASEHGAAQSDKCLMLVSRMLRWWQARDSHFVSPVVPGMRRYVPISRSRILSDDELRALWKVQGTMADAMKFMVLTGQRRSKVLGLRFGDVVDGCWVIRKDSPREKGHGEELELPPMCLDLIERQRIVKGKSDRVFRVYQIQLAKAEVDAMTGIEGATLHDLRRSARSLLSRAGVRSHVAERILGHRLQGVEGVYDRWEWKEEKAAALKALASLVDSIVTPPLPTRRQACRTPTCSAASRRTPLWSRQRPT